ncbi:MAG: hypothetical protein ABIG61_15910 [Planctomycetota bacterium]
MNTREKPYGPSPHGASWGDTPWEEAYQLPGSNQTGLGKKLLERYPWQKFEPHQDWIEAREEYEDASFLYAAGVPGQVRFFYFASPFYVWWKFPFVKKLESGVSYSGFWFDPKNGREYPLGLIEAVNGCWDVPQPGIFQDWVLVLEAQK